MRADEAWPYHNARVVVTGGWYRGQSGRAIRPDGTGTWMVHLDGRMFGASVPVKFLRREARS